MEQARRALREGRAEDAQAMLVNVIVRQPEDDEAWLLLAEALSDPNKKRECLERAQAVNPRNAAIQRALARTIDTSIESPSPPVEVVPVTSTTAASTAATAMQVAEQNAPAMIVADSPQFIVAPEMTALSIQSNVTRMEPLIEYGEMFAQAVMLTTEPTDTRNLGWELLKILDGAAGLDATLTRRWARSAGRAALVKYEKALTVSIASLPRDDSDLLQLREQRQRALNSLK